MKYLKKYESLTPPEIGDYVYCNTYDNEEKNLQNFLNTNLGKIIDTNKVEDEFLIEFENLPDNLQNYSDTSDNIWFDKDEILHWSKNPKDLEIYISVNKYNL